MPNLKLSHWEATDIASFLLQSESESGKAKDAFGEFELDKDLAKKGQRYFSDLGCATCHQTSDFTSANLKPSASSLENITKQSLTDTGCLSAKDGNWPAFTITDKERKFIAAALTREQKTLSQKEQIDTTLTALNCLACHQRNELGGVTSERDRFFHTANENLGPQGRIPPPLTNVGAKLNPKWMRDVLINGKSIRPYMKSRMPQFGLAQVEHLIELFSKQDSLDKIKFADFKDRKKIRDAGHQLVGNQGLNCVACHTFQQKPGETMPAVDLTEMQDRLQKEWFYQYMKSPQRFSPNTVMPTFWPGGRAMRKEILDGSPDSQIEAIWQYLKDGRQARTPRGLIRKPMELVATDEAIMLRRSYPGIGKRGIGVGYPNQVNLVFDAEQIRLAMLWKGKFADPSGVFRSQGHGTVRPLAREQIRFAKGTDLNRSDDPWIFTEPKELKEPQPAADKIKIRPPNHKFRGYFLDDLQRPTFMYSFGEVKVEDYFTDPITNDAKKAILHRAVTFTSPKAQANFYFRLATDSKIEQLSDGTFRVGEKLSIRLLSDQKEKQTAKILDWESNGQKTKQLVVPFSIEDKHVIKVEYRW